MSRTPDADLLAALQSAQLQHLLRRVDPGLLARLEFDTEAGGVGYARQALQAARGSHHRAADGDEGRPVSGSMEA